MRLSTRVHMDWPGGRSAHRRCFPLTARLLVPLFSSALLISFLFSVLHMYFLWNQEIKSYKKGVEERAFPFLLKCGLPA